LYIILIQINESILNEHQYDKITALGAGGRRFESCYPDGVQKINSFTGKQLVNKKRLQFDVAVFFFGRKYL
jgi:hypothetical protein